MTLKDATMFWTILSFQTQKFPRGLRWITKTLAVGWFLKLLLSKKPHIFAARMPPPPPPPGADE
jgi:hypothetical protein